MKERESLEDSQVSGLGLCVCDCVCACVRARASHYSEEYRKKKNNEFNVGCVAFEVSVNIQAEVLNRQLDTWL